MTLDITVASGAANGLLFCHEASMLQQIILYVSLALFILSGSPSLALLDETMHAKSVIVVH